MRGELAAGIELGRHGPVADLFEALAARPEAPLLRWPEGAWTVAEFAERARRCATALTRRGVGGGDRVGLLSLNSPHQLAWQYGIYMLGAVEVPINNQLRGPMLAHVLDDSKPTLVLAQGEFAATVAALDGAPPLQPLDGEAVMVELDATAPLDDPLEPSPETPATILYTSGTTGPSKGVILPHGAFSNLGQILGGALGMMSEDVGYFTMPFFHIDFHIVFPATIQRGASIAFRERFSVSRFWDDVREFGVTWWFAIGALLAAVMTREVPEDQQQLALRRILGAPIPAEAYEFYEDRLGIPIQSMYGQTEADGPLFETATERRRGSAGRPVAGFDVAVLDPAGEEVPFGTLGELAIRPQRPNMMCLGYWGRPEATLEALRGLWFHTGDLAVMEPDGFVFYRGRMTDSLRRRGENVSVYELEASLREAAGVADVAAIGVVDELGGEDDIKVFVALEEGADFDPQAFFAYCSRSLPRFAVPRYVELAGAETFVRSVGTGVVQKHLLSRDLGPGTFDRFAFEAEGARR